MIQRSAHTLWTSLSEPLAGLASLAWPRDTWLWRGIAACGLAGLVIFLAFYHLDVYPAPDTETGLFDDGQHLLAARTLAVEGRYDFGPATGPTVILPVAAAMRLFGPTFVSGHAVMALYLLLNVAAFYILARQLGGWQVSLAATLIYVIAPGIKLVYWAHRVMGDVPAVLFTLAGLVLCFKGLDEPRQGLRRAKLVVGGILFGLAILSKNQFFLLLPAWMALWVLDWIYYRQAKHSYFILPILAALLTFAGWYAAQLMFFPNGQQLAALNLSVWSNAPGRGIFTLSTSKISEAIRFLTDGNVLFLMVLPGWLYAALRSLRRSREGLRWAALVTITTVWLGWFIFFSVAWPRYAYFPLTLSVVFVVHFFYDMTGGFRVPMRNLADSLRSGQWDLNLVGKTVFMALFIVIVARGIVARLGEVIPRGCDTPQQMASYVMDHVPPDASIDTFNPEVCFLSGHACILPPGEVINVVLKHAFYDEPPPSTYYHLQAPFLLVGYSTFFSGIYDKQTLESDYERVESVGDSSASVGTDPCRYDLYRKK